MWAVKRLQRQIFKPLPLLSDRCFLQRELPLHLKGKDDILPISVGKAKPCPTFPLCSVSGIQLMSTTRGRSMRSKVEKRMQRETGKTMREIRRAKKLRKKLMTEEERLIYNLRRAKKKVALLLQKLKKYELPEFPAPRHDPELLTAEQLQAYKKIGFRNRNYMLVGVRGVFGGVILNMHLHWKHHETVQVCCDNFPKEKIKEMATMLARLSGGIVINIHNVKTIIMFRGRNYRQPKIMEPFNTLTKRKALFRARFEQALDSQKLNIKKIEQQLRRKGVNPEDPIAMASIQRVASTFFRAIDERQGTPYVFRGDRQPYAADDSQDTVDDQVQTELSLQDSDQEELDRFIAEIEDAADQEWAAEEAAEREEASRIRYWGNEEEGMMRGQKSNWRNGNSEDNHHNDHGSMKRAANIRKWDSSDDVLEASDGEGGEGSEDEDEEDICVKSPRNRPDKGEISYARTDGKLSEAVGGSDSEMFGGSEGDDLWESEDEKERDRLARSEGEKSRGRKSSKFDAYDYDSGSEYSDEENFGDEAESRGQSFQDTEKKRKDEQWDSD